MEAVEGIDYPNTLTGDGILPQELGQALQAATLQDEWETPPTVVQEKVEDKVEEKADPAETKEKPKPLTEKQKKRLRMKEKYRNMPKSKSHGQPKPTGFEESFTEVPITPDEHEYERDIYNSDRPVIFRIQEALNRYQKKRRLLTERMQAFSLYLRYGGVEVGAKMFGGVSEMEMKAMEKEEIIVARSQTDISIDKMRLDVDFELVTKAFLSFYLPEIYRPEGIQGIKLATDTIRNWLNYLLYHDVVPEYSDNIKSARKYCNIAEKQLWDNQLLLKGAPGDFNKAYGIPRTRSMTPTVAQKIVMFALAASGTDEQSSSFSDLAMRGELSADGIQDIDGFEVVDILLPHEGIRDFYNTHAPDLNFVGKVRAKAWRDPNMAPIDLAPGETLEDIRGMEFEFFLEEHLLQHCHRGMKVATCVYKLNCGVFFFDEIFSAYCSFFTPCLNDLMMGWRTPRDRTKKIDKDEEVDGVEDVLSDNDELSELSYDE
ncbi:conserved hypothetical protein [Talaromyces stipitatus ATCC 10500]|uniref:Argonaute siRNA chaperone complex subunit Arb1 n=1 Tax=Talaromyces stipitatus (strain ATCC 10500 / CBS 375.48 / QM 6759 / NRRL 1006) TaxID=441959 RepID=B8LTG3_TALSN|nr:uncharacterized protein TSTA_065020 [Talaromyces stipitatus ATCC 10500]EED23042.1 conserved hypothetical protein [Talaromyces stipitatus ATCC 10500]